MTRAYIDDRMIALAPGGVFNVHNFVLPSHMIGTRRMHRNTVGMVGGLGNQLFQFAFGKWLQQQSNRPTTFDTSAYRSNPKYFSLSTVPTRHLRQLRWTRAVPYPTGQLSTIAYAVRRIVGPRRIVTDPMHDGVAAIRYNKPAWYYGYWQFGQVATAVLPEVRLSLSTLGLSPRITTNAIAVHVRRGDMLGKQFELPLDYFPRAISLIKRKHNLPSDYPVEIFSDDLEWCRAHLNNLGAIFMDTGAAITDMFAIAERRFIVMSGSTFSWWAAHLIERDPSSVAAPFPFMPSHYSALDNDRWLVLSRDRHE
jgi:hypothetical protein